VVLENATEFEVRRFLSAIAEYTGELRGKRILDYGCGKGVQLGVLANFGAEAVGIEQSETARENIANAGVARAYADIESMQRAEPFTKFDHILLSDVVEHLREPWVELSRLRSLLSPGGRFFLTTPNTRS
jgi:2-polyprenyl-3-methyl-5-hydroxy-6-metoxy-1,4-benzoquinol methylase